MTYLHVTGVGSRAAALQAGCATRAPGAAPDFAAPGAWSAVGAPGEPRKNRLENRWTQLRDPAVNSLGQPAVADSPTLAQAVAHVDAQRQLAAAQHSVISATPGSNHTWIWLVLASGNPATHTESTSP